MSNGLPAEMVVEMWDAFLKASWVTQGIVMLGVVFSLYWTVKFICDAVPKILGSTIGILCKQFMNIMSRELRNGIKNSSGVERADYIVILLLITGFIISIAILVVAKINAYYILIAALSAVVFVILVASLSVVLVYLEGDRLVNIEKLRAIIEKQ